MLAPSSSDSGYAKRLADGRLDGKTPAALRGCLSRGHLSRPACSHVKQIAKRPGTREPGRRFFPAGFLLAEGGPHARVRRSQIPPRNPARACRHAALAVRRNLGGAVPHPGLRLRQRRCSAEKRFKNEEPGYQYSRFSNPTVTMFEQRMAALEGAEAARATATGMAAVTTALMGQVRAGDHVVASKALFGSCRYVVEEHLPRYGVASTLVDGTRPRAVAQGGAAEHQDLLPREPDQSDARSARHRGDRRDRARGRRHAGGRQRVLDAALPAARSSSAPTAWSIRPPSTSTARAAASAA